MVEEAQWQGHRLVGAHNPQRAAEQTQERLAKIHALQQRANQLASKLDAQDGAPSNAGASSQIQAPRHASSTRSVTPT